MKEFLGRFFDEIRIIAYVRPPVGFKISFFQQRLQYSSCNLDFMGCRLLYHHRFDKFDEIFGREHVLLRKFAPATFVNGCVVADFCNQIGIPLSQGVTAPRVNESLCREACAILYAYRKFGPGYGVGPDVIRENKQLLAPLFQMQGSRFRVSDALVLPGLLEEDGDLRWMEQRLGESLSEGSTVDGTELTCEEDLLEIDGASCRDFAVRLAALYQLQIADDRIPAGSRVDPQAVADFVEYCRCLCRERTAERRALKSSAAEKPKKPKRPSVVRVLRKCWRVLKRRLTAVPPERNNGPVN